jgi:hypothetical protein
MKFVVKMGHARLPCRAHDSLQRLAHILSFAMPVPPTPRQLCAVSRNTLRFPRHIRNGNIPRKMAVYLLISMQIAKRGARCRHREMLLCISRFCERW